MLTTLPPRPILRHGCQVRDTLTPPLSSYNSLVSPLYTQDLHKLKAYKHLCKSLCFDPLAVLPSEFTVVMRMFNGRRLLAFAMISSASAPSHAAFFLAFPLWTGFGAFGSKLYPWCCTKSAGPSQAPRCREPSASSAPQPHEVHQHLLALAPGCST